MYAQSLFALAFAFCTAASASAEDKSFQAQVSFAAGDQGQLMVPMPDANRAAPDSMEIRMLVSLSGFAAIENTSKVSGQGVLITNFGADLTAGKQSLALGSSANFYRWGRFDGFDGRIDFQGASARTFDQSAETEGARRSFEGKELATILRNNDGKGLRLGATGGANNSLMGLRNAAILSRLQLFVQVEVTYRYPEEPVDGAPGKTPPASPKDPMPAKQTVSSTAIVSNKE